MKTLIRGARVVLPGETLTTSVMISGNKIVDIDVAFQVSADEVVDGTGKTLIPGVIDDQVHFRDPGYTDKEDLHTATMACAKGGVTSFLEMPNTNPTTTTVDRLNDKLALASTKSLVNYGFFIGATPENIDELSEATRTPGIKIFIGSSTGELLVDDQDALERIFAETTLPLTAHCEDETTMRANRERVGEITSIEDHSRIRDHQAALVATQRATELARRHRHRFHVLHVSTAAEIDVLRQHERLITSEVCLHHLFFSIDDYKRLGSRIQMNPSIKTKDDNRALWQALQDDVIQIIATDHAPHTLADKAKPYPQSPAGLPAVENSLALMLNRVNQGQCTIEQVVQWMCSRPARIWDIENKGRIERGCDADLVLIDMQKRETIRDQDQWTKCRWSPWDGVELVGWPVKTWVQGRLIYDNGQADASKMGREITFDHQLGGYWAVD
ncbi:MAG: dihydroorotase [Pirellulaceae bacterium]